MSAPLSNDTTSTTATNDAANAGNGTLAEGSIMEASGRGEPKPVETAGYWKARAREQEKLARSNAPAVKELEQLKESLEADAQKVADGLAEVKDRSVSAKTAEALKTHLIELHQIAREDAELFLTGDDPELLLQQVGRLIARSDNLAPNNGMIVPNEGRTPDRYTEPQGGLREFTRDLFGDNDW